MREPSDKLRQWDDMACETACTAQLLYMYGKLKLKDVKKLDRRIGRKSGEADQNNGNLRVLFEEGFHIETVTKVDTQKVIDGMEYVRDVWINQHGRSEEETDSVLPELYPILRQKAVDAQKLERRFASQYRRIVKKKPSARDFAAMLAKGWHVDCGMGGRTGYSHRILVIDTVKGGKYRVYDPSDGISFERSSDLMKSISGRGFTGIYMPQ